MKSDHGLGPQQLNSEKKITDHSKAKLTENAIEGQPCQEYEGHFKPTQNLNGCEKKIDNSVPYFCMKCKIPLSNQKVLNEHVKTCVKLTHNEFLQVKGIY